MGRKPHKPQISIDKKKSDYSMKRKENQEEKVEIVMETKNLIIKSSKAVTDDSEIVKLPLNIQVDSDLSFLGDLSDLHSVNSL